ncbi:MAG: hypothetical protein K2O67_02080, partial [Clostridia bacterium]|nr:hypothetical protein [Clostridia bacterium]
VLLSGALGMAISTEKKREFKIFSQFYEFNEKLLINLKYGREKVKKVAEGYQYVEKAIKGGEVLKGENGEILRKYIEGIGESDALTQVDYLNAKKQELDDLRQKSEANYKKYGSLYFKLSVMAGILIAVLLA